MLDKGPKITVCIPHWQVRRYITVCLRSIKEHSRNYNLDVLVIDNGSQDDSLDYLRSLSWIRLIERPDESQDNWPRNVFTAWDRGIAASDSDYFVTMHSDVFVKRDGWLDPMLQAMTSDFNVAGAGAWKLTIENPFYATQKRVIGYLSARVKASLGLQRKHIEWQTGHYPRDYCAMYRSTAIVENHLSFIPERGESGGYAIAKRLWQHGYRTTMVPLRDMDRNIVHVAHGTAAINPNKRLNHVRTQKRVERKVANLFEEPWINALEANAELDSACERVVTAPPERCESPAFHAV